jgi:hypothetical protein
MAYSDLHVADAVYHSQCNSNFRTGMQIPQTVATTPEDNLKRKTLSFTGRLQKLVFTRLWLVLKKDEFKYK